MPAVLGWAVYGLQGLSFIDYVTAAMSLAGSHVFVSSLGIAFLCAKVQARLKEGKAENNHGNTKICTNASRCCS